MVEWRLGNYELRRRLGEGGMAQVYLALDVRLGREVAVKVLDRTLADRPGFRERFMREARVAAALDHPNIVPLFDFGDTEALFLVMPYISGGSLQDVLPRAPLPIGEVVTYGSQIADALEYAHHHKVVHRDVKPANMLIHADGRLMLSDFGLAKIVNATSKLQAPRNRPDAGTPEYMAPEQVAGSSDARSDIYGLGVVLYLLLTGRLPFSGSTSHEVMRAHLYKDPKPVRAYNPSVPVAMEAVVMRAMAKEPSDRFQRAGELGAALLSALIADANDAPTFVLGGGPSSQGGSRPTGQAPIVMPPPVMPEQPAVPPPWRQHPPSGPIVDAASFDGGRRSGGSAPASAPRVSEWGSQRSQGSQGSQGSSSSLTGILPELDTPFTGLDAMRGGPSGVGLFAGTRPSGAQGGYGGLSGASLGGMSGAASGIGGSTDSQAPDAAPGPISARTLGRMPAGQPPFPTSAGSYLSATSSAAPDPFSTSYAQPMQPPIQPQMQRPIMSQMDMTPPAMYQQTPAAPQQQRSELRATLPGSRLTEPPAENTTHVRSSRLWIVIAALLIILLVAVVVLLRWLEAGPAAFTLFALI